MPITINEIRNRAHSFVKEWEGETRERAGKQKNLLRKMHSDKTITIETITPTFKISRATMHNIVHEGNIQRSKKI